MKLNFQSMSIDPNFAVVSQQNEKAANENDDFWLWVGSKQVLATVCFYVGFSITEKAFQKLKVGQENF